jgi:hypothetical protein
VGVGIYKAGDYYSLQGGIHLPLTHFFYESLFEADIALYGCEFNAIKDSP